MQSRWMVCVFALVFGCSEDGGNGGVGGDGGAGGMDSTATCEGSLCPCTTAGIRAAIAEGGGPFTFDCDGPTTVMTETALLVDNDVILDGEGNLTVEGDDGVFSVAEGVTAELRRVTASKMSTLGPTIDVAGKLTLTNSTVDNSVRGPGTLTVTNSTVTGVLGFFDMLTVTNSTVEGPLVLCTGTGTIVNSTLRGGFFEGVGCESADARVTIMGSVVDNTDSGIEGCGGDLRFSSLGHNIESPGNTCGLDQSTDQVNVSAGDLKLGELADNGGPTITHALGEGSVAIDQILSDDCEVETDQRGLPRDSMCDVGAFEVQP